MAERNNATWENGNRQMLELFYVRHTSLALDSRIFVIAFKAMGGAVVGRIALNRGVVIGVAAHKPHGMPAAAAYLPVHVAAVFNRGAAPGSSPTTRASPSRRSTPATPGSRASIGCGGT